MASRTSIPAADIEDLWSALIEQAARPLGAPGALPAGAEGWNDTQLAAWLRTALARDVTDLHRSRNDSAGQSYIVADPLEHLAESLASPSASPEREVVERQTVFKRLADVHELAGDDALRLVLADASGASVAEQQAALGFTRGRMRTVRMRIEMAGAELRSRAHAVIWFFPDLLARWMGSGAAAPRVGVVAVALTAALAGGAGVATQVPRDHRPTAARPALASPHAATVTVAARPAPSTRQATSRRRTATAAAARSAVARQAASRQRARARARARARQTRAEASKAATRAEFDFETRARAARTVTAAPAPRPTSFSSSAASVAEAEFQPGIH